MSELHRHAVEALEDLDEQDIRLALGSLSEAERLVLEADWPSWAHEGGPGDSDLECSPGGGREE
jgi:hypothetical protein